MSLPTNSFKKYFAHQVLDEVRAGNKQGHSNIAIRAALIILGNLDK